MQPEDMAGHDVKLKLLRSCNLALSNEVGILSTTPGESSTNHDLGSLVYLSRCESIFHRTKGIGAMSSNHQSHTLFSVTATLLTTNPAPSLKILVSKQICDQSQQDTYESPPPDRSKFPNEIAAGQPAQENQDHLHNHVRSSS